MRSFFPAAIAFALLSAKPAWAGTYTVMNDGRGDFDSVQAAVDAVPEGSTLLLTGSFAEKVTITKSLRLVGGTIYTPPVAGDLIQITGADWVVIENLTIPSSKGYGYDGHGHAIVVKDARFFALLSSTVEGQLFDPYVVGGCGSFPSGFDAVRLENVGYARITSCELFGAPGTEVYAFGDPGYCGEDDIQGGVGGAGLHVDDQCFAVALDTLAVGGDGGNAAWNDWEGRDLPPNSLVGGDGGNGVNGDVWSDGSKFAGGKAGTWSYVGTDWGIGSNGNDGIAVNGVETPLPLPEQITVSDLVIGQSATISGQGFQSSAIALLFFATDVAPPLQIRQGAWMLELPWVFIDKIATDGAGSFTLKTTIPDDPSLVALLFFLQAADMKTISEPQELIFTD